MTLTLSSLKSAFTGKKLTTGLLVLAMGTMAQSCSEEEVAVTAAVVAVGAAAVSLSNNNNGSCYRTRCSTYYDYYGHRHRECRRVRRHHCHRSVTDNPLASSDVATILRATESKPFSDNLEPIELASAYKLSVDAAERFLNALQLGRQGSLQGIEELGLDKDDLKNMARFQLPKDENIDKLAQNLNQQTIHTRSMLHKINRHARDLKIAECKKTARDSAFANNRTAYDHFCKNRVEN